MICTGVVEGLDEYTVDNMMMGMKCTGWFCVGVEKEIGLWNICELFFV